MPKFVTDILSVIYVLVAFIVKSEATGLSGPEKKAAAIAEVVNIVNKPDGLEFPKFLPEKVRDLILSILVDAIVMAVNKLGFFGK